MNFSLNDIQLLEFKKRYKGKSAFYDYGGSGTMFECFFRFFKVADYRKKCKTVIRYSLPRNITVSYTKCKCKTVAGYIETVSVCKVLRDGKTIDKSYPYNSINSCGGYYYQLVYAVQQFEKDFKLFKY